MGSTPELESRIFLVRGRRVMLDSDLAEVYGTDTRRLNQQVRRNLDRFPEDFGFLLSKEENRSLMSQSVISKRGGRRKRPWVLTEHGAVMLASVLRSPVAVRASLEVVRAFVRLRSIVGAHRELARRLDDLERMEARLERIETHLGNIDATLGKMAATMEKLLEVQMAVLAAVRRRRPGSGPQRN